MKHKNISIRFRKQLKEQLPILRSENLISEEQTQALTERYHLNDLAAESTSKLLVVIYSIGIFLIGVGVISFVAYHWNAMGQYLKLAIIFSSMLISHGAGFYLWKISDKSPKLGHALICLGTLIFGANIGLIAQIFHIKGQWNGLFLPWAVGAIVMAFAVASVPNAAIAVITSVVWFFGQMEWHSHGQIWWFPLAAVVLFGGFAYFKRSIFIFIMTLLTLAISVPFCIAQGDGHELGIFGSMLVLGLLIYNTGLLSRNSQNYKSFTAPAIMIGILLTAITLFLNSFIDLAEEIRLGDKFFENQLPTLILAVTLCAAAAITIPFAIKQLRGLLALKMITVPMIVAPLLLPPVAAFTPDIGIAAIANLLLLILGVALIWSAHLLEDRRLFWGGVLTIAALVIARTIEYETGLLIKSAVFIACGITLMIVGVIFEKYLRARRSQ